MLKFQAVAEKMAKNFRGLLFLPHPVHPASRSVGTARGLHIDRCCSVL